MLIYVVVVGCEKFILMDVNPLLWEFITAHNMICDLFDAETSSATYEDMCCAYLFGCPVFLSM